MLYQERDEVQRQKFQEQLNQFEEKQLVWVDECGLNRDLQRLYGRCPRHQRLYDEQPGKRFIARTSLIAAYTAGKLVAPLRFEGYTDTQVFNLWLEECLLPELQADQVIILDNATFHKSTKTQKLIHSAACQILFLPPYSPDLNKIEPQWANLKQGIRTNQNAELNFHQKLDAQLLAMAHP